MPGLSVIGVLPPVKLDDETMFVAHEVDNERAHRNLATKTQPFEAMGAQLDPKGTFGIGHL